MSPRPRCRAISPSSGRGGSRCPAAAPPTRAAGSPPAAAGDPHSAAMAHPWPRSGGDPQLAAMAHLVLGIREGAAIVVIHTRPGAAQAVAALLDQARLDSI